MVLLRYFVDVDDDGWLDLVVANDSVPNYLYRNQHDGTFEDVSYMSGFAVNEDGRAQASMGIGVGDYNRDGKLDLFITTFSDDYKALYRNDGDAAFTDVTFKPDSAIPPFRFSVGAPVSSTSTMMACLDIFIANGHVYPIVDKTEWGTTWAQRPLLFRNLDGAKFQEVPPATGSGLADVISARGAAFGDLFNDGHIDVVLNNIDSPPTLLRNVVKNSNHWLTLKLVGGPKSPRDAIGAKVFLTAGRRPPARRRLQRRQLRLQFRPSCPFRLGSRRQSRETRNPLAQRHRRTISCFWGRSHHHRDRRKRCKHPMNRRVPTSHRLPRFTSICRPPTISFF